MKRYATEMSEDLDHVGLHEERETCSRIPKCRVVYLAEDAEAAIAEARSDEREQIYHELKEDPHWNGKYMEHSETWRGGYNHAMEVIKSRSPCEPKKLEKFVFGQTEETWQYETRAKINAIIDLVNDLRGAK